MGSESQMKWASSVSMGASLDAAVAQAAAAVREQLDADAADLAMVFVSPQFSRHYERLPRLIQEHLPSLNVVGCSAGGVIGGGLEVEESAAVSITAAKLPEVGIALYYSDMEDLPDGDAPPEAWKAWLPTKEERPQHFILLADPFSVAVEPLLRGLDYAFPASIKLGGVASGASKPGENILFTNEQIHRKGVILVGLAGNLSIDTIVAQGCRPIGKPVSVTACNQNVLLEVDGSSPMAYLQSLLEGLNDYDRELIQTSLFLGVEMDSLQDEFRRGDFLIRNIIGVDQESGAVAIGSFLHDGMVVQFHLRDKISSAEDLEYMLQRYKGCKHADDASGALLFSCMGRGRSLDGASNHDASMFKAMIGAVPLGGFFCNGEIGPVGAATYVHGYTSSFGIFRPAKHIAD